MRLSIVGIVALLLGCALAHTVISNEADAKSMYEEFKRKYNKAHTNEDDDMRFAIFRENLKRIDQAQKNEQGTALYGVTKFADLTVEEFTATHTNAHSRQPDQNTARVSNELSETPLEFDWRQHGAVGPVLDQGSCYASWAFSTVGNIEGQYAIKHGKFVSLSKQQLIDCDHHAYGCHGGYPPLAYEQIIEMGGLMSEADYPFKARAGFCSMDKKRFHTSLNNSVTLPDDERYLVSYLHDNGPLSAAVNAGELQFYESGIFRPRDCSSHLLNLDVLLIGYSIDSNHEMYWIVKNSWGENWGEKGYFRMHYGKGTCGINRAVSSAILKA